MTQPETSFPLGATIAPGGVNFSVFSKHATGVQLLFFAVQLRGTASFRGSPDRGPEARSHTRGRHLREQP